MARLTRRDVPGGAGGTPGHPRHRSGGRGRPGGPELRAAARGAAGDALSRGAGAGPRVRPRRAPADVRRPRERARGAAARRSGPGRRSRCGSPTASRPATSCCSSRRRSRTPWWGRTSAPSRPRPRRRSARCWPASCTPRPSRRRRCGCSPPRSRRRPRSTRCSAGPCCSTASDPSSPTMRLASRCPRADRGVVALFSATMLTSAILLFSVQPMVARFVLPTFGSAPQVWAVALVFFQAVLLLGYLYAHLSSSRLGVRRALTLHAVLLVAPVLTLPLGVPAASADTADGNPALVLLGLLTVSVGLPFFVVSSTAPLLQRWLVHTDHPAGKDPYFLYRASNFGSVLGLVSYPLLFEPRLTLDDQGRLWTWGYAALVGAARGLHRVRVAVEHRRTKPVADRPGRATDRPPPPHVARARRGALRPDRGRDHDADHRRRADPAAVGAAARPLPDHVHDRVLQRRRVAARLPAVGVADAGGHPRRDRRDGGGDPHAAVADHRRAPARGVRRGDGLPRPARPGPPGAAAPDDLLPRGVGRRRARRRVRGAGRPGGVQRAVGVPAGAAAGRAAVARRAPRRAAARRRRPRVAGRHRDRGLSGAHGARRGEPRADPRRRRLHAARAAPAARGSPSACSRW